MAKSGFINLHRKIQDNFLWKERRVFSRAEAWIDILMEVRWQTEPGEVVIGTKTLTINQAECLYSLETWAGRWKWSKSRVKRFLGLLEERNAIRTQSETQTTRIKVCNYCEYNKVRNTNGTGSETQTSHNLNNKERNKEQIPYVEIVEYLNFRSGKKFSSTARSTKEHINARWKEGHRLEHFLKVIDHKCGEWRINPKMEKYMRPETLFGTKFEGYLNEKAVNPKAVQPSFMDAY